MEREHFEQILDAKLDPITRAIEKLEKQNEKIVDIIADQKMIIKSIAQLETAVRDTNTEKDKVHDEIFRRIRECELSEGNKLWDIVKIMAAGLFGGIVTWLAGNR